MSISPRFDGFYLVAQPSTNRQHKLPVEPLDWEGAVASVDPVVRDALLDTQHVEWAGHLDEDGRIILTEKTLGRDSYDDRDEGGEMVYCEFDVTTPDARL